MTTENLLEYAVDVMALSWGEEVQECLNLLTLMILL